MKPALTAEEWAKVREPLVVEWAQDLPPKRLDQEFRHGLAARCLHEQEFGFTREDVDRHRATLPDTMPKHPSHHETILAYNTLVEWINSRVAWRNSMADRLEVLLPPEQK